MRSSAEPLTNDQLKEFIDAAEELYLPQRLIANIVPFTGLWPKEFVHLRKTYVEDGDLDDILIIHLPNTMPCTSVVFEAMGTETVQAPHECSYCKMDNEARDGRCRTKCAREVHVTETRAQDFLRQFFRLYDEMPLNQPHKPVKKIVENSDIDRPVNYSTLVYTRIRRLGDRGLDIVDIAKEMGIEEKGSTLSNYGMEVQHALRASDSHYADEYRIRDYFEFLKQNDSMTAKEIANEIDRHPSNVRRRLNNAAEDNQIPIKKSTDTRMHSNPPVYSVPADAEYNLKCSFCGIDFDTYRGKRIHESKMHDF